MLMTKLGVQRNASPLPFARDRQQVSQNASLQQKLAGIVGMAANLCSTPFSGIQVACEQPALHHVFFGTALNQIAEDETLLQQILSQDQLFAIPDLEADSRFADSPLIVAPPHLRFYASMPLRSQLGSPVGALFVADLLPRTLTSQQAGAVEMLARHALAEIELRANSLAFEATLRQHIRSQNELQNAEARLSELSEIEEGTGVLKRQPFLAHLDRESLLAARYRPPLTLLLVTIDAPDGTSPAQNNSSRFVPSDPLASWLAGILLRLARQTDFVARLNREIFAVLMPSTDATGAKLFIQRVKAVLAEALYEQSYVTACIGAATFHGRMRSGEHLLTAATSALDKATAQGKGDVYFLEPLPGTVTESVSPLNYTDIGRPAISRPRTGRVLSIHSSKHNIHRV